MFSRLHRRRSNLQDLGRLSKSCPAVDNEHEPGDSDGDGSDNSGSQSWGSAASLSAESVEEVAAPISRAEKQLARQSLRHSKQREVQQKRNMEQNKISMDDYLGKQAQFRVWLQEEQKKEAKDLSSPKRKTYFKMFVRLWNKRHLAEKYYESRLSWTMEGETTSPSAEKQYSPLGHERGRFSLLQNSPALDPSLFPHTVDLSPATIATPTSSSPSSFSTFGKTTPSAPPPPFRFTGAGGRKAVSEDMTAQQSAGIDPKGLFRFGENKENAAHFTKSATLPATLPATVMEDLRTAKISPHKKMVSVWQDRSMDRVSISWSPRGQPKLNPVLTPRCPSPFLHQPPTPTPSRGKDSVGYEAAYDVLPSPSHDVYHQVKDCLPSGSSPTYAEIPVAMEITTAHHAAVAKAAAKVKGGQRRRSRSMDEAPMYAVVTPRGDRARSARRPLSEEVSVSPPPVPPKRFDPHVEGLGIPFSPPPSAMRTADACGEGRGGGGGEGAGAAKESAGKKSSKPFRFPWFGRKLTSRRRSRSCEVLSPSVHRGPGEGVAGPTAASPEGLFPLVTLDRSPTLSRRALTRPVKPPGQQNEAAHKPSPVHRGDEQPDRPHQSLTHSTSSPLHRGDKQPDRPHRSQPRDSPPSPQAAVDCQPDVPQLSRLDLALSPPSPARGAERQIRQVTAAPHRLKFELMQYASSPMRVGGAGRGRFAAQGERSKGGVPLRRRSRSLEHVASAGMERQEVGALSDHGQGGRDSSHSQLRFIPPPPLPSSYPRPVSTDVGWSSSGALTSDPASGALTSDPASGALTSDPARSAGCEVYDELKSAVHSGLSSLVHSLSGSSLSRGQHTAVQELQASPRRPGSKRGPHDPPTTGHRQLNSERPEHLNSERPEHLNSERPEHLNSERPEHLNSERPEHLNSEHPEHLNSAEGPRPFNTAQRCSSLDSQGASQTCAVDDRDVVMEPDRETEDRQPVQQHSGGTAEQRWTAGIEGTAQCSSGGTAEQRWTAGIEGTAQRSSGGTAEQHWTAGIEGTAQCSSGGTVEQHWTAGIEGTAQRSSGGTVEQHWTAGIEGTAQCSSGGTAEQHWTAGIEGTAQRSSGGTVEQHWTAGIEGTAQCSSGGTVEQHWTAGIEGTAQRSSGGTAEQHWTAGIEGTAQCSSGGTVEQHWTAGIEGTAQRSSGGTAVLEFTNSSDEASQYTSMETDELHSTPSIEGTWRQNSGGTAILEFTNSSDEMSQQNNTGKTCSLQWTHSRGEASQLGMTGDLQSTDSCGGSRPQESGAGMTASTEEGGAQPQRKSSEAVTGLEFVARPGADSQQSSERPETLLSAETLPPPLRELTDVIHTVQSVHIPQGATPLRELTDVIHTVQSVHIPQGATPLRELTDVIHTVQSVHIPQGATPLRELTDVIHTVQSVHIPQGATPLRELTDVIHTVQSVHIPQGATPLRELTDVIHTVQSVHIPQGATPLRELTDVIHTVQSVHIPQGATPLRELSDTADTVHNSLHSATPLRELSDTADTVHNSLHRATPLREFSDTADTVHNSLHRATPLKDTGTMPPALHSLQGADSSDQSSAVMPVTTRPQHSLVCETPSHREVVRAPTRGEDLVFSVSVPSAHCFSAVSRLPAPVSARHRGPHRRRSRSVDHSCFPPLPPAQTECAHLVEGDPLPSSAPRAERAWQMKQPQTVDETQPVCKRPPPVPSKTKTLLKTPTVSESKATPTLTGSQDLTSLVLPETRPPLKPQTVSGSGSEANPVFRHTEASPAVGDSEAKPVVEESEAPPVVSTIQQQFGGSVRPVTRSRSHRRRSRSVNDMSAGREGAGGGVMAGEEGGGGGGFAGVRAFWDSLRGGRKAGGAEREGEGGGRGVTLQRKPSTMRRLQQQLFGTTQSEAPTPLSPIPSSPSQPLKAPPQSSPLEIAGVGSNGEMELPSPHWKDSKRASGREKNDVGQPGAVSGEVTKLVRAVGQPTSEADHTGGDRDPDNWTGARPDIPLNPNPAEGAVSSPAPSQTAADTPRAEGDTPRAEGDSQRGEGDSPVVSPFVTVRRRSTRKKSVVSETVRPAADDRRCNLSQGEQAECHPHPAVFTASSTPPVSSSAQTQSLGRRPALGRNSRAAMNQGVVVAAGVETTSTDSAHTLPRGHSGAAQGDRGSSSGRKKPGPPPKLLPKPSCPALLEAGRGPPGPVTGVSVSSAPRGPTSPTAGPLQLRATRKRRSEEHEQSSGGDKQRAVGADRTPEVSGTPTRLPPHHHTALSAQRSDRQAGDIGSTPTPPPVTRGGKRRSGEKQDDLDLPPLKRRSGGGGMADLAAPACRTPHVTETERGTGAVTGQVVNTAEDPTPVFCTGRKTTRAEDGPAVAEHSRHRKEAPLASATMTRRDRPVGDGTDAGSSSSRTSVGRLPGHSTPVTTRQNSQGTPVTTRQNSQGTHPLTQQHSGKDATGSSVGRGTAVRGDSNSTGATRQSAGTGMVTRTDSGRGQRTDLGTVIRTDSRVGRGMVTRTDSGRGQRTDLGTVIRTDSRVGRGMVTRTDSGRGQRTDLGTVIRTDSSVGRGTAVRGDSNTGTTRQSAGRGTVTRMDSGQRQSGSRGSATKTDSSIQQSADRATVIRTDSSIQQSADRATVIRTDSRRRGPVAGSDSSIQQSTDRATVIRTDSGRRQSGSRGPVAGSDSGRQQRTGQRMVTTMTSSGRQSAGRGTTVVRNDSTGRPSGDGTTRQHRQVVSTPVRTHSSARRRSSGVGVGGGGGGFTPTSRRTSAGKSRRVSGNSSAAASRSGSFRKHGVKPPQSPTFLRITRHLGVSEVQDWDDGQGQEGKGQPSAADEEQARQIIAGLQKTAAEFDQRETPTVISGREQRQPTSLINTPSTARTTPLTAPVSGGRGGRRKGEEDMETDLDLWEDDESASPSREVSAAPLSTMV